MLLHFIFVIKDKDLGLRDAEFEYIKKMAKFFKSWIKTKFSIDIEIQCDEMITKPRIILQRLDTHSLLKVMWNAVKTSIISTCVTLGHYGLTVHVRDIMLKILG